jgi:IS30 family transposase
LLSALRWNRVRVAPDSPHKAPVTEWLRESVDEEDTVNVLRPCGHADNWLSLASKGSPRAKAIMRPQGPVDISERPAIVARKTRLGDWEGDTVVGAGHKGGLLTLLERKTQLAKITKLPRATARATQKAAVRRLKPIGNFVHTITFDNGKEFAAHQDIAHALKAKIFFATPYHAWERGLNENTNGLIRDFFPKGTDFSTISNAQVAQVERLLNARPRKSLGFRSPQEVFHSLAYS